MNSQVIEPIQDKGNLSLVYDSTPGKDPYFPSPSSEYQFQDYRYQGYPVNLMTKPRIPLTVESSDNIQNEELTKNTMTQKQNGDLSSRLNPEIDYGPAQDDSPRTKFSSGILPPPVYKTGKGRNPYVSETEEIKLRRHQMEAADDVRRFREEKERQRLEGHLEKKQNFHMLQHFDPWGKPGHGAPRGVDYAELKKQKFLEEDLKLDKKESDTHDSGLQFYKPGHGAPLRTESGKLVTSLPGHKDIRFQDVKKGKSYVEPLRYKNPETERSYARELEEHMMQQSQLRQAEKEFHRQEEIDTLSYDPFGKPGAGAPNESHQGKRTYDTIKQLEHDELARLRQERERHQALTNYAPESGSQDYRYESGTDGEFYPWGKGYGNPLKDEQGNVQRYPFHDKRDGSVLYATEDTPKKKNSQPIPEQPSPRIKFEGGTVKGPDGDHIPPSHRYYGKQDPYFPFGRPGAGAPLKDSDGQIITTRYGPLTYAADPTEEQKKAMAARIYSDELEQGMIEHNLNKKSESQQRRAPVNDFTDLLTRGQVGKPIRDPHTGSLLDQHLPSSDVTHINYKTPRHKFQSVTGYQHLPDFVEDTESYGSELQRAAEERAAMRRLEKMRDVQEARQHAHAADSMFGRPGYGAPYKPVQRKLNLNQTLFNPDNAKNEFRKPVDHVIPVHNTAYVRNDILSTHKNAYEFSEKGVQKRAGYNILTPYALH